MRTCPCFVVNDVIAFRAAWHALILIVCILFEKRRQSNQTDCRTHDDQKSFHPHKINKVLITQLCTQGLIGPLKGHVMNIGEFAFFASQLSKTMTKEELLRELMHDTFVMLRPSPIEGIGVFAIRDIPKGTRNMFSKPSPDDKWIPVSKDEVANMPDHAQRIITNYSLYDEENYFVPDYGFKKVDICLFLNHSDSPNVVSINDGDYFEAIRDIASGEELLIDYGMIVDGE
jgi:SET domain-containing protein